MLSQTFPSLSVTPKPPEMEDEPLLRRPPGFSVGTCTWIYEHFLQIIIDLHGLLAVMGNVCNPSTCKTMKVNEAEYMCAAHGKPRNCCAIDYCCHIIEGTRALLLSEREFPERVAVAPTKKKIFVLLARRCYRILSHAYFHHQAMFKEFEHRTGICARFHGLVQEYDIMASKLLIIPVE